MSEVFFFEQNSVLVTPLKEKNSEKKKLGVTCSNFEIPFLLIDPKGGEIYE